MVSRISLHLGRFASCRQQVCTNGFKGLRLRERSLVVPSEVYSDTLNSNLELNIILVNYQLPTGYVKYAIASWFRHCPTSRKLKEEAPDRTLWRNRFGRGTDNVLLLLLLLLLLMLNYNKML